MFYTLLTRFDMPAETKTRAMTHERNSAALAAVKDLAAPILDQAGAELVDLIGQVHQGVLILRLLVDKVGGVTIQECADLNRRIGEALETAGVIQASYTLEISSPGLDRPLVSRRDFERAIGETLQVWIREEKGTRQADGQLLSVQADTIVLRTKDGNLTIAISDIHKAKKVIKLLNSG